ncbi:MAG: GDSL-type esterase/lipase family protein [Verrucomicrobiota bacterium]
MKPLICLSLLLTIAPSFSAQTAEAQPASITPVVQDARWAQRWWMPRYEEKLAEAGQRGDEARLLFIGDSITHYWDQGIWAENFDQFGAFNLGFSGDRTEHVLWRIQHGALANLSPEVTVIMIGTNNTGHGEGHAPADTLLGIEKIITEVQQRLPETKIILHSIFPRGATKDDPKRLINDKINEGIPALAQRKGVLHLDLNDLFLEKDGTLSRTVMPDLLHPEEYGYQLWAEGLMPTLNQLFGQAPKPAERKVIPLWPNGIPQPHDLALQEKIIERSWGNAVTNVDEPSLTLYLKKSRYPTGFVLVCPGGGYNILAWDHEGIQIAEWLNSIGFSAAILKYRVPKNREGALQDAQRALGYIRSKADEWNVQANRIGILGFSAGGHLSATASNRWADRTYPRVDAADDLSCRPDFTVLVYPAYMGDEELNLKDEFAITEETPPVFIVQTQDDTKYIPSAFAYSAALHKAGIPCELHIFPTGGHGYGLRPSAYPVSQWENLCRDWLRRQ